MHCKIGAASWVALATFKLNCCLGPSVRLGQGMALAIGRKEDKKQCDSAMCGVGSKKRGSVKRKGLFGSDEGDALTMDDPDPCVEPTLDFGMSRVSVPPRVLALSKLRHSRETTPGIGVLHVPVVRVTVGNLAEGEECVFPGRQSGRRGTGPMNKLCVEVRRVEASEVWDLTSGILREPCSSFYAGKLRLSATMNRVV